MARLTFQDSDDRDTDSSSDDTDRELPPPRGRRTSSKVSRQEAREAIRKKRQQLSPSRRTLSPVPAECVAEQAPNRSSPPPLSFTRSRSPHMRPGSSSSHAIGPQAGTAPQFLRYKTPANYSAFLPATVTAQFRIPFLSTAVSFSAGSRSLAESALLLGSLFIANRRLTHATSLLNTSDIYVSLGKANLFSGVLVLTQLVLRNRYPHIHLHYIHHVGAHFSLQSIKPPITLERKGW